MKIILTAVPFEAVAAGDRLAKNEEQRAKTEAKIEKLQAQLVVANTKLKEVKKANKANKTPKGNYTREAKAAVEKAEAKVESLKARIGRSKEFLKALKSRYKDIAATKSKGITFHPSVKGKEQSKKSKPSQRPLVAGGFTHSKNTDQNEVLLHSLLADGVGPKSARWISSERGPRHSGYSCPTSSLHTGQLNDALKTIHEKLKALGYVGKRPTYREGYSISARYSFAEAPKLGMTIEVGVDADEDADGVETIWIQQLL